MSLAALRYRAVRLWFVAVGLFALVFTYVAPTLAPIFFLPSPDNVTSLPKVALPSVVFPELAPPPVVERGHPAPVAHVRLAPKAQHTPAAQPHRVRTAAPATAQTTRPRTTQTTVPVVENRYSLAPAETPASEQADPFEKVPVVDDTIGITPELPADATVPAPTPVAAEATPAVTDAAPTAEVSYPAADQETPRSLLDASAPEPEPAAPVADEAAPAVEAPPAAPETVATAATPADVTAAPAAAATVAATEAPTATVEAAPAETIASPAAEAAPPAVEEEPDAWIVTLAPDLDNAIELAATDSEASITINGALDLRQLGKFRGIEIKGGKGRDRLRIDDSARFIGSPVTFDGGDGVDGVEGPSADTTWTIDGANSGSVAGVDFANVEDLQGAADNADTFVFEQGGTVSGVVDGGAGGSDRVFFAGSYGRAETASTGEGSGTVTVDGATIRFAGMEQPALNAEGAPISAGAAGTLDAATLAAVVAQAASRAGPGDVAVGDGITFTVADLPGSALVQSYGRVVTIDADAAGWGWYVEGSAIHAGGMDLLAAVLSGLGSTSGLDGGVGAAAELAGTLAPRDGGDPSVGIAAAAAPQAWDVQLGDTDNLLVLTFALGLIGLSLNGLSQSRSISTVSGLTIRGGSGNDLLEITSLPSTLQLPILFDGRGGVDTIRGPPLDVVWSVTGPGSGTVGGVAFAGVEQLEGAAANEDTFVFEAGGSISGTVDGGAGGYDTLVLGAASFALTAFTITGPTSGTISRDGDVITYIGLEPTIDGGSGAKTFTGTGGADTITITTSGASLLVDIGVGEDLELTAPGTVTSLTVNALGGADTITISSLPAAFTGSLTIDGGDGDDTLAVADVAAVWKITAVNAGSYTGGGRTAQFSAVESLTGAPTADDSFEFESGAGLTGTVADGAGTLTVGAVGFVKISGDLDFVRTTHTVTPTNGTPETPVSANVLTVSGPGGAGQTGFVGVEPLDNPIGIQGTLGAFALAIFTAGTRAWHAFDGTFTNPEFVAFEELDLGLSSITVVLYDTADDDSWLNHSANPLAVGTKTFNSPSTLVSVSVPASITVSDVVHLSATFTFARGGTMAVDVATGWAGSPPPALAAAVAGIPVLATDTGVFGRSADWSTIYNLPVTSFQIAATNLNVFFGDGFDWTDTDGDEVIDLDELGSSSKGFLLSGGDIGFLLLSGGRTGVPTFDALVKPRFYALSGAIDSLGLVNISEFALQALSLGLEVNQGKQWDPAAPAGSPAPVIDWVKSFGPGGFSLIVPGDDPVFDFEGKPVVGFSADRTLLRISDAVHISGSFSFRAGPVEYVDVVTGLTSAPTFNPALANALALIPASDADPGGQTLGRSSDYSILYNVPVRTIQFGASGVSVFLGWAPGLSGWNLATDDDGILSRVEFNALTGDNAGTPVYDGDAIGFFVENLSLGLLSMNPAPFAPTSPHVGLNLLLPRLFALNSSAASASWVGFEEHFELQARGIAVEVNQGTAWLGALPGTPAPAVDWKASFPGDEGYRVQTGTTTAPVTLDFEGTPLVGVSADKVLLQISDAVLVTGSFSVRVGPVRLVDVATGLHSTTPLVGPLAPLNTIRLESAVADPETDMWRTADFSMIHNLRVNTLEFGAANVSVFLGWAPGLGAYTIDGDADGILSRAEFNELTGDDDTTPVYDGDAIGFFVENLRLGLLTMNPVPLGPSQAALTAILPRLFALNSRADSASWVGFEEHFELQARGIAVEVNQGRPWLGAVPGTPNPAVDWQASFPDTDGYDVRTGTTTDPVKLDFEGTPLVGVSADNVIFQISDAVLVTGSFSIRVGPVRLVDVATGLKSTIPLVGPLTPLNTIPLEGAVSDPDTDMWRAADYSMIHNLRVNTLEFGASSVTVFLGWAPGLGEFTLDGPEAEDGVLSRAEFNALTGDDPSTPVYDGDAIGFFVESLRLGLLVMNPVPLLSPSAAALNAILPRLFALNSHAVSASWVGFEEHFELQARGIAVEMNQGSPWVGALPGTPNPAVDWQASFPDTNGYDVRTGTTTAPVKLDFEGTPLVGVSADRVLLQISDAVLVTGSFSIRVGPVRLVDVATGLNSSIPLAGPLAPLNLIPLEGAVSDPDTDMWRAADYSTIHNLRVNTLEFGTSAVTVFLGWAPGLGEYTLDAPEGADGVLSRDEFNALTGDDDTTPVYDGDAIGFFIENLRLGMLVMNPVPLIPPAFATLNPILPRLFALNSRADSASWVGFEEHFELQARGIAVEVNQGSPWIGALPGTPNPAVDWKASFPDTDGAATEDAAGYEVRTGTTTDPVLLDFEGTPLVGVSADKVLLQISDAVLVTGSFSFRLGPVRLVDVATGLQSSVPLVGALTPLNLIPLEGAVTNPETDLWRSADYSMIHNLRVNTLEFGASAVSVFLGWAPGLGAYTIDGDADGILSRAEFDAFTGDDAGTPVYDGDAIGFFVENLALGMLVMNPVPLLNPAFATLNAILPRLFALSSHADSASWVGFEEHFELQARGIAVEVNQGSPWVGVLPGTPNPAVDWVASFPDTEGYEVRTGTTTDPVLLDFEGTPLIGVSADKVLLQISDAVLVTGSFSIRVGPVRLVDVATGLESSVPLVGPLAPLNLIPLEGVVADPETDMWRSADYSMIHNLRVNTLEFGASAVTIFLGWAPGLGAYTIDGDADGILSRAEFNELTGDDDATPVYDGDAIGFLIENLALGLLLMNPVPLIDPTQALLNPLLPRLFALNSHADSASWVGFEEHFELQARGIAVEVNQGTPWPGALPGTPNPAVDWKASFPDTDGYEVRTGTTTDPVLLDFEGTPLIGVSADAVLLQISDAVLVTGSFSVRIGPVRLVDVATGLHSTIPLVGPLAPLNLIPTESLVADPDTDRWRADDFSMIHNLRVNTLEFGAAGVSVFLGWAPGLGAYTLDGPEAEDGVLSRDEFNALTGDDDTTLEYDGDAIGFFIENLRIGMLAMSPVPSSDPTQVLLNQLLPKLFALKARADSMGLVGLEDFLEVTARGIGVDLNLGTSFPGVPPGTPVPTVDWKASFPDTNGYEVRTGTTTAPVLLDFDGTPLIGVSADRLLLQISDFVHISGSFSFRLGPVLQVDLNTGLTPLTAPSVPLLSTITNVTDTDNGSFGRSTDFRTLWNVAVNTLQVGTSGASVFVGYASGLSGWSLETDDDGILSEDELPDSAVGFFVGNLTLGFLLMNPVPFIDPLLVPLNAILPKLFSLKAEADDIGLLGIPGIELSGHGVRVEVNLGTRFPTAPPTAPPPAVDYLKSFPDSTGPDGDADTDPDGYPVATGTTTDPVVLTFDGFLIGGGAENVHIELGQFVYIDGAIYFEIGRVHHVQLADSILPIGEIVSRLGLPAELESVIGATEKDLAFLTVGGKDLQAFFGVNGPYWIDADGDGEIDRDPITHQIVDAETNDEAIGLVIDDLTFGLAFMTPINPIDPTRYIALKGEASFVGLVGLEDYLVLRAEDISVELNISTPLLAGFPLLPVVDFIATFGEGGFGVKTGARDPVTGDDITVDLKMDGLLVKAGIGFMTLDVLGVVTLNGSLGFELGPTQEVTLADGTTKTVKILTIGAANVYGFIGFNGPYIHDSNGNGFIDRHDFATNADGSLGAPLAFNDGLGGRPKAVGFAINDLDLGIFVGIEIGIGTGGAQPPSLGVYVAGLVDIDLFGFVGIPGFTAVGSLAAAFNVGASTSGGFSPIDFIASFPDSDGEAGADQVGYEVFTGDKNNPILLGYDDFIFQLQLVGAVALQDVFALVGFFYLEVDSQGLKLLTAGRMVIGPDLGSYNPTTGVISTSSPPMLSIQALGALVINGSGVALDVDVDVDVSVPGLDLFVSARVLLNTTGVTQQIALPTRLLEFLDTIAVDGRITPADTPNTVLAGLANDLLSRLVPCSSGTGRCYSIDGAAPNILVSTTLFNLLHNPAGPIVRLAAGPYVVVVMSGGFDFLGFARGEGVAGIGLSRSAAGTTFQFFFDVQFAIGVPGIELVFQADGAIELSPAGVFVDVHVELNADITSLFHLDVSGDLTIDTRPVGTANDFFILELSGRLDVAGLISVSGGLVVRVGGPSAVVDGIFYPGGADSWRIAIPESNKLTGSFGPLTIELWGFIQSDGQFSVNAAAFLRLGVDGFGIEGHIAAGASLIKIDYDHDGLFEDDEYELTFYISGGVRAEAFGIGIGVDVTATVRGRLGTSVTVNIEACVDLLFGDVCANFDLFDIQLPATILPQGPPKLAQFPIAGSTTLELNVGANSTRRRADLQGFTAESYRLTQLSPGTVKVELLNTSGATVAWEVFSGVSQITGDFGSDNDTLVVLPGATIPVNVGGGPGNDLLSYLGSGPAILNGGDGNDTLIGGSGTDVLIGGANDDYLDGRGGVDSLNGGTGNDILFGLITNLFGATPETLDGGDGTDVVEIVGTPGNDSFTVGTTTVSGSTRLQILYTGASPGSVLIQSAESILLNPQSGADTVVLTGELEDSGLTNFRIIMGDGTTDAADRVTSQLLATADSVDITGGLAAALTSNVRGDGVLPTPTYTNTTTSNVPQTVAVWSGHYTVTLNNSGRAQADLFTIQTGDGADTVQVKTLATNTRIESGDGDDRIAVGSNATATTNAGGTLDGIDAALTIVGGAPTASDVLLVDDTGDPDGETGQVTATTIDGWGLDAFGIAYSEIESISINLGGGGDTANVRSTAAGATTTINGGGGADTFRLSSDAPTNLGSLNLISGALTIDGGAAGDTAFLSDRADGGVSDTGTLAFDTLTGYSPAVITYLNLETLDLDLGAGANNLTIVSPGAATVNVNSGATSDVVVITSVAAGTTVTVNGEATADVIVVNGNDGTLIINGNAGDDDITINATTGTITVNGDAGADFVKVVGLSGTGTVNGGTENDDIVVRALTGTLTVNGNEGDDWVGILTTAVGSTLTVNGNDDDDVVEVGSNAELGGTSASRRALDEGGTLDAVDGGVTANGNAPGASDWLYVDDTGDDAAGSGETGFLTATTITGLGMAVGITYGTIEELEISLGDDGTQFNVLSTNGATDTLLQAGGGDDTINVSSDAPTNTGTVDLVAGHLTIQGEAGIDTTNVDDRGDTGANTGTLTATELTGLDMGPLGITYTTLEHLNIDLGSGGDTFTIVSTHTTHTTLDTWNGADTVNVRTIAGHTEITTGAEADVVNVGSLAPATGGTVNGIGALLAVSGDAGDDELNVDDTGDALQNAGVLTATTIEGFGTVIDPGHAPSDSFHVVTITNAFDGTFTIAIGAVTTAALDFDASIAAVRDALIAALGVTAADLDITRTLHGQELVFTVGFTGALAGAAGRALGAITVDGSALVGIPENGTVASSASSMSSGRIAYLAIEDLTIGLGSGDDVVHVRSTHAEETTLNAGPGNDTLLIETITGTTAINGESGNDRLVLNPLPLKPTAANGINDDVLTFDGQTGSDLYVVNVFSVGDSELTVHDSGTDLTGFDRLVVNGTAGPDQFLFRAFDDGAGVRRGLVALLSDKVGGVFTRAERIVYDLTIDAGVTVNGLGGNDHFAFDDTASVLTVNGGSGEDTFQVGQVYGDTNRFDDDWPVTLTAITRGQLSNGVSYDTTINGGDGPDHFFVFHNIGPLQLNGDAGDDEFVVRTFLGRDEETRIHAGGGRDLIQYVANAPVAIDGGDGFDSVVVIGTEADDDFVINATGIYGAGRFVSFQGVERVDVDGAEGDDTFAVLSTPPGVQVRIFGGLGSDTINVGADGPTVFADDLLGHSGVISSAVESTNTNWNGIHADGVVAEVADDDEAGVIVTPTDGSTRVSESGAGDSYTIVLAAQPTANVVITVSAPSRSPEAELDRSYSVQLSLDGVTWTDAVTLVFAAGNWNLAQTVRVRAYGDFSSEGERSATLQHLVVSGDAGFDGIAAPSQVVRVIDDDLAAVVVVQSGVDTVVTESGTTDGYTVSLTRAPLTPVTVTLHTDGQTCVSTATNANAACGDLTLTFTPGSWSPQAITVRAASDTAVEGFHFSYVTQTVASGDVFAGSVTAVTGSRVTLETTQQFAETGLRGYLLRLTAGDAAGSSWRIWGNTASISLGGGRWSTVVTIQGEIETSPAVGDDALVNGYTPPVATGVLQGTVASVVAPATVAVSGLSLPTANGGLSGATVRIFVGDATEFRTIASNTATTITFDSEWTIAVGTAFSIVDIVGVVPDPVFALVADDDAPGVLVTQSDGSTRVSESGIGDSYTVVLTSDPGASAVTVTLRALATETLNAPDGAAGYRNVPQVWLSLTPGGAAPACLGLPGCDLSIQLVFDAAHPWNVARTVYVHAIDDAFVDGSDLQAFADVAQRVYLLQGPLTVNGGVDEHADRTIPAPVLLPGETTADFHVPESPSIDVVEDRQVDTLNVHNEDSVSADTGLLTATRLTGLGLAPDQFAGGRFLLGGIEYTALEALTIHLGSGADSLRIDSTHTGTTVVTGGAGADAFDIRTIDGHTDVSGDGGNDTFRIGTQVPTLGGVLDELDALLVIDGGAGLDTAIVDDSGDPVGDDNLGTLTQTTITGLDMVSTSVDRLYSLTIGATTTKVTFTVTVAGVAKQLTLNVGFTAAELEAALQSLLFPVLPDAIPRPFTGCGVADGGADGILNTRCSQSVFVWRHDGDFLIGFRGELHGIDVALSVVPAESPAGATATDLARMDGINYYGFGTSESLTIDLGAGNDRFNVRGTLPHTVLNAANGDDLVYVSDAADLGAFATAAAAAGRDLQLLHDAILHGTVVVDDLTFSGSLDRVVGRLDVHAGAGSNTLSVSDRDDADADTGVLVSDAQIAGLAPGLITYDAVGGDLAGQGAWTLLADSGLFGRGINIYAGQAGDTISVTSVHASTPAAPYDATVTSLFAGGGDDNVTVSVAATLTQAAKRRLVLHGNDGADTINASASSLPVVVFGDAGGDVITGGTGNDQLFGDDARVHYVKPAGVPGYDVVFGGDPDGSVLPATLDGVFLTPDLLLTRDTTIGAGDTISAGPGNDIVLGGRGSDTVHGDAGNDLILGDFARVATRLAGGFVDAGLLPLSQAPATQPFEWLSTDSTNTADAAGDALHGDAGEDVILGQQGSDTITGGGDDDDLTGGHNVVGGLDAGDVIDGGDHHDVILGDNGTIHRTGSAVSTLVRQLADATLASGVTAAAQVNPTGVETRLIVLFDHPGAPGTFGSDTIAGGTGNDVIFGELGNDTIQGDGAVTTGATAGFNAANELVLVPSFDTDGDGDDYVEGGGGNDIIFGNLGQDDLIGGSSSLFGLAAPTLRPDGVDTIFGGSGTMVAQNNLGLTGAGGHARDADTILGDNGNVFRIVSGGGFRAFAYDTYPGGLRIIIRSVQLLDYSPTGDVQYIQTDAASQANSTIVAGTNTNVGGGDFIRGESGDDVIHGQTGSDRLWGDGQDDDLYGESGYDWISGGAGDDGILGDDGVILTSRNGIAEPLYGLAATTQAVLSLSRDQQTTTIYSNLALRKEADLEPFYIGHNDVLYGGLGDDWLHAGAGDDAVSGAEALALYYKGDPLATLAALSAYYAVGNVLQHGFRPAQPEEFRWFNENDPWRKILVAPGIDFLLNFVAGTTANPIDDGQDVLFGDTGHDWLVGGTNHDRLWGGYGDDLLQGDDNLDSTAGTADPLRNDIPDTRATAPVFADIGYGGAGRDILIVNTAADRMFDWNGEFNSYFATFMPYGEPTVNRLLQPGTVDFLYQVSRSDGADRTRPGAAARNGEPFGELGLVMQSDADWGDQQGGPADPQPGGRPNPRDAISVGNVGVRTPGPAALSATLTGGPSSVATIDSGTTPAGAQTIAVPAVDAAGNVVSTTVTVSERASTVGIASEVEAAVARGQIHPSLRNVLLAQLNAAQTNIDRVRDAQAVKELEQFIAQVQGNAGGKIDGALAARLVGRAQGLIAELR